MELNGVLVVLALLSNKGLGLRRDPNSNGIKIIMVIWVLVQIICRYEIAVYSLRNLLLCGKTEELID